MFKHGLLSAAAIVALFSLGAPAGAITFQFSGTPTGGTDGAVNGTADFSLSGNILTIVLTDLLQPATWSAGNEISGVSFSLTGATGSGALATTNNGNISTINSVGTYTAAVANALTRWTANETGALIALSLFSGGPPSDLIIGPDSAGGFANAGIYNTASSVQTHNPSVLGSATFALTIPGTYTLADLSNIVLFFGTGDWPGSTSHGTGTCIFDCDTIGGGGQNEAPLPAAVWLMGSILGGGAGVGAWRRRKQRTKAA
jgi:hypothetical protein